MPTPFRDYEHVLRIVALFIVGAAAFLAWRAWMVPADFGLYGHYRALALEESRARPAVYAGQESCAECHDDVVASRRDGRHAGVSCEACHGPLRRHALGEDTAPPPRPDARTLCATCHAARQGKPARFPQVDVQEHAGDASCVSCHQPHTASVS